MICQVCGIEWERHPSFGKNTNVCPRCQTTPGLRHPLADEPPMPSAEIEALKVQLLQIGWTRNKV